MPHFTYGESGSASAVRPMSVPTFTTKDSGKRDVFETGMQRDSQDGKGRFDLVPFEAMRRIAQLFERGAQKYDPRNWEKGQPFSRAMSSLLRHAFQAAVGMEDEDHLAAVVFNAMVIMTYQERIKAGVMKPEDAEDDLPLIYRQGE